MNHAECVPAKTLEQSHTHRAYERLTNARGALQDTANLLEDRLRAVLLPEPAEVAVPAPGEPTAPGRSELANRIDDEAYRLEQLTGSLRYLIGRLDV